MDIITTHWNEIAAKDFMPSKKEAPLVSGKCDAFMHDVLKFGEETKWHDIQGVQDKIRALYDQNNHEGILPVLRNLAKHSWQLSPIRHWATAEYKNRIREWAKNPAATKDVTDELRRAADLKDGSSGLSHFAYKTFFEEVDNLTAKMETRDPQKLSHAALILTEAVYLDPYDHEYNVTKNLSIPRFESYMEALRETSRAHFISTFTEAATYAGGSARFDAALAGIAQKHLGSVLNETMGRQETLEYLYQVARADSRTQKAVGDILVERGQRPKPPSFYH